MILLIARFRISEAQLDNFQQALRPFLATSRAELGCIRFTVSEDSEQPNYYLFTAIFQDEAALHEHESSAHLSQFKQAIGTWIVEREKTQVYLVSEHRDLSAKNSE